MTLRDLVPTMRRKSVPIRQSDEHPFSLLQRDINSLFNGFFSDFETDLFGGRAHSFNPGIEVSESDREITVSAELPGMDEKDINVTISDNTLTIAGEKKDEKENREQDHVIRERSYGSFSRSIPLSREIDSEKIKAHFRKGLLKITLPKSTKAAESKKKITVKAE